MCQDINVSITFQQFHISHHITYTENSVKSQSRNYIIDKLTCIHQAHFRWCQTVAKVFLREDNPILDTFNKPVLCLKQE